MLNRLQNVRYREHNSPLLGTVIIQMNPLHTLKYHSPLSSISINLMLHAPCIILQYVYKPTRCTKFLQLDFIFY